MQNKYIPDDNVSLFESLVLGDTLVDQLSPSNAFTLKKAQKIVESVKLSSKPKSASGQIVASWEGLENAKTVADVKKFIEDNLAEGNYKQKVLMNLARKRSLNDALGYVASIVAKGDGITLNKRKKEKLETQHCKEECDKNVEKEPLEEAIPRDLAKAMRNSNYRNINTHGGAVVDFENAEYEEITPEEAQQLRRENKADEVLPIADGEVYAFYHDGVLAHNSDAVPYGVRKQFGPILKAADKIYRMKADPEAEKEFHDKRANRREANSLKSLDTYYGRVVDHPIDDNSGKHVKASRYVAYAQDDLRAAEEALAKLEDTWEAGDISRNAYTAEKEKLEKALEIRKQTLEKEKKRAPRNQANEHRYDAQAQNMSAARDRYTDIKRHPADIAKAEAALQKANEETEKKIAELEKELARLRNDGTLTSQFQRRELEDEISKAEKQAKDLEAIRKGTYTLESLQERLSLKEDKRIEVYKDTHGLFGEVGANIELPVIIEYWNEYSKLDPILISYNGDKDAWLADTLDWMEFLGKMSEEELDELESLQERLTLKESKGTEVYKDLHGLFGEVGANLELPIIISYWDDYSDKDPILLAYNGDKDAWLADTLEQMEFLGNLTEAFEDDRLLNLRNELDAEDLLDRILDHIPFDVKDSIINGIYTELHPDDETLTEDMITVETDEKEIVIDDDYVEVSDKESEPDVIEEVPEEELEVLEVSEEEAEEPTEDVEQSTDDVSIEDEVLDNNEEDILNTEVEDESEAE